MNRHISFILPILAIGLHCLAADTAAVSDFKQTVDQDSWDKLIVRLNSVNQAGPCIRQDCPR